MRDITKYQLVIYRDKNGIAYYQVNFKTCRYFKPLKSFEFGKSFVPYYPSRAAAMRAIHAHSRANAGESVLEPQDNY